MEEDHLRFRMIIYVDGNNSLSTPLVGFHHRCNRKVQTSEYEPMWLPACRQYALHKGLGSGNLYVPLPWKIVGHATSCP